MTVKAVLVIDGSHFDDYAGFGREFSALLTDHTWHSSLDAFNDILHGGYGTPEGGFVLRWLHSDRSRHALGWTATVAHLEDRLAHCHPDNRDYVRAQLAAATRREGPTLFDTIVEILRAHGPGGTDAEDGIELDLA